MTQTIICFIIVLAALIYLLHYFIARYKNKHCGSCGDCSGAKSGSRPIPTQTVVSIPLTTVKKRRK